MVFLTHVLWTCEMAGMLHVLTLQHNNVDTCIAVAVAR